MIDKRERERGREDVYERIKFNVSYEMWKFLLTNFSKLNERYFAVQK